MIDCAHAVGGAGSVGQVTTPAPVSTTDQAQNIK